MVDAYNTSSLKRQHKELNAILGYPVNETSLESKTVSEHPLSLPSILFSVKNYDHHTTCNKALFTDAYSTV